MLKIYNKKTIDYETTKNENEWLVSIEHEVETIDDLLILFEIFSFYIQDSFSVMFTDYSEQLLKKYHLKTRYRLTFKYADSSISLSSGNMFNFTQN
jgi:hypothetical protein